MQVHQCEERTMSKKQTLEEELFGVLEASALEEASGRGHAGSTVGT